MPIEPACTARDIAHRFGRVRVLEGIDLALVPGECVVLHGANGSGKTTLLRILAGLLRPQRGTVAHANGRPMRVAFVGQAPGLYAELSTIENLDLFARLNGLADPGGAAAEALDAFGLAHQVDGDALSALRLTGLDGGALFLGKWAAATAFTLAIACVLAPLWVALFALRPGDVLGLAAVAAAGVPGWAAAGVLVAGISATARGREVLLPILLFPLLLPLVLAAVRATGGALAGAPLTELGPALALMAAYDVIFCVVGFWLFPVVVDST